MIQPRFFVVVRVIQKLENGNFIEYQESIQNTPLKDDESVKQFIERYDNLGNLILNGISYEYLSEN